MDGRENFYQRLLNDAGVKKELGGGNIPEIVGRIKIRSTKSFFERSIFLPFSRKAIVTHFYSTGFG